MWRLNQNQTRKQGHAYEIKDETIRQKLIYTQTRYQQDRGSTIGGLRVLLTALHVNHVR